MERYSSNWFGRVMRISEERIQIKADKETETRKVAVREMLKVEETVIDKIKSRLGCGGCEN